RPLRAAGRVRRTGRRGAQARLQERRRRAVRSLQLSRRRDGARMTRGLFFSLDGIDGCGKSTQSALLAEWLRSEGHNVVTCRDPGGTVLGDQLRAIVLEQKQALSLNAEALLFMVSRAQLV